MTHLAPEKGVGCEIYEVKCLIPRNQYASLLQTHQTLRSDYQKLLSVASELTAGLETVAQTRLGNSQQIDWKNVKNENFEFVKI